MRSRTAGLIVGLLYLAFAPSARAYFVIDLADGGELRANYVREDGDVIYASREAGELRIERSRIRRIREIDPGAKVDVTKSVIEGGPSAPPTESSGKVPPEAIFDPSERENQVVRQIILGQRDLLFARLRGDAPEELAERERELKALKGKRAEIQKRVSPSPAAAR